MSSSVSVIIVTWIQIAFQNYWNRLSGKKVKGIIDYEAVKGTGYQQDISAIKEGEGSITYATGGSNSRDGIYGLTDADKSSLRRFRRLRGYD